MSLERIRNTIKEHDMISPGDSVVVGLSGGPDSACLLHALAALRDELGIREILAVHVNHGLRGAEAGRDEAYAKELAESLGVSCRVFQFDIAAEAKRSGVSSETAGRRARYESFALAAREMGAARTAVAHNRDDQAETILMRILRGTGIHGLRGIEYTRPAEYGTVIRPLLDLSRAGVEAYCETHGIVPVHDSTNSQAVYTRNRIRLELLPHLREYNPAIDSALVRLGRLASEDDDYIALAAGKMIRERWNESEKSLETADSSEIPPAVAKRVVMEVARRAGAGLDLSEIQIRSVLGLFGASRSGRETDLSHGCYVKNSYGKLWFLKRGAEERNQEQVPFPVETLMQEGYAEVKLSGHFISIRLESGSKAEQSCTGTRQTDAVSQAVQSGVSAEQPEFALRNEYDNTSMKQQHVTLSLQRGTAKIAETDGATGRWDSRLVRLDWEALRERECLVFRFRRPGDLFRPKGMKGRKKLKALFSERKVPQPLRDGVILLADGSEILAAGGEASDECREKPESELIVSIEYWNLLW